MQHTLTLAISANAQIRDDHGQAVQNYIGRIIYLVIFFPDFFYIHISRFTFHTSHVLRSTSHDLHLWLIEWRADLAYIWLAAKILARSGLCTTN